MCGHHDGQRDDNEQKRAGPKQTPRGSEKAELCRKLGADLVIDHRSVALAAAVNEATDGRGADVIFDPVGGLAFDQALDCIASEGRLLGIGYASGEWGNASPRPSSRFPRHTIT